MQEPTSEVEELKQLIAHRGGSKRNYPPELKARVNNYASQRYGEGAKPKEVAEELGMNAHTLTSWRERRVGPQSPLRPVRVIDEVDEGRIVVLVRNGIRVEGLSLEQLIEVLRHVR